MQRARVLVLVAALAYVPYIGQASSEDSTRTQQRGLLSLLKAASRIAKQYSPSSPYKFGDQDDYTSKSEGYPPPFLRYISPSDQQDAASQREPPLLPQRHVGNKPLEDLDMQNEREQMAEELSSRPIHWAKKSEGGANIGPKINGENEEEIMHGFQQVSANIANNFLRAGRSASQPYDVPQIECPPAEDQMDRFPCPSPDRMGRYRCIDDHVLCDGFIDCPDAEDEDRQHCMFYKTTKAHLDIMADAIIRFIRSPK